MSFSLPDHHPTTTTTSTIPSTRNNNFVAESDYNAAIAALQNKFQQLIERNHTNDADSSIRLKENQLLNDCSNSLVRQIQTITQPISDEAFHIYFNQFKENVPHKVEVEPITDGTNKNTNIVVEEAVDIQKAVNEVVFTEEELMDQNALVRVQELRQCVREKVDQIIQLRHASIQRSIQLTERQIKLLLSKEQHEQRRATSEENKRGSEKDVTNQELIQQHYQALQKMKESFIQLQQTTSEMSSSSMKSLRDYQMTIDTIQEGLLSAHNNTNNNDVNDDSNNNHNYHPIEQAIYRRDYFTGNLLPSSNNNNNDMEGDQLTATSASKLSVNNTDPEQFITKLLCPRRN